MATSSHLIRVSRTNILMHPILALILLPYPASFKALLTLPWLSANGRVVVRNPTSESKTPVRQQTPIKAELALAQQL
jgi:hypothetical protein